MARIGRHRHKRALAQAQQIVPPHQPQHALVVRRKPVPAQLRRDPPVPIAAVGQRRPLHRVSDRGLFLARRRCTPLAVIAGAGDPRQRAQSLDRELALRPW
jgi:hypothetical protein